MSTLQQKIKTVAVFMKRWLDF